MKLRTFVLIVSALLPCSTLAQDRPAPPPKADGQKPKSGPGLVLTPSKEIVTIFLTSLAALKYCAAFTGQENAALLGQGYNLRPGSVDPAVARPILQSIESQVAKGKEDFCRQAWKLYGPRGTSAKGLLGMPGTAQVAGRTIEPSPQSDPSFCEAWIVGKDGLEPSLWKFFSFTKVADDEPDFWLSVASSKLKLRPADKTTPVSVEIGSDAYRLQASVIGVDELRVELPNKVMDRLKRSASLTLRIGHEVFPTSRANWSEVVAKLDSCAAATEQLLNKKEALKKR